MCLCRGQKEMVTGGIKVRIFQKLFGWNSKSKNYFWNLKDGVQPLRSGRAPCQTDAVFVWNVFLTNFFLLFFTFFKQNEGTKCRKSVISMQGFQINLLPFVDNWVLLPKNAKIFRLSSAYQGYCECRIVWFHCELPSFKLSALLDELIWADAEQNAILSTWTCTQLNKSMLSIHTPF